MDKLTLHLSRSRDPHPVATVGGLVLVLSVLAYLLATCVPDASAIGTRGPVSLRGNP